MWKHKMHRMVTFTVAQYCDTNTLKATGEHKPPLQTKTPKATLITAVDTLNLNDFCFPSVPGNNVLLFADV